MMTLPIPNAARRSLTALFAFSALAALPVCTAQAQTPAPAEAPLPPIQLNPRAALPITPEEKKNIEELLRASGAVNIGKMTARLFAGQVANSLRASRPNLPPHVAGIINEEIARAATESVDQPDGPIDMLAQLYHKYYSDEEISQLLAFYQSPVGRKTVQVMPLLLAESQGVGRLWGAKLAPLVLQRVQERLKDEAAKGGAVPDPQASAPPPVPGRLEIAVAPRPIYPAGSRADREEGNVRMKVLVAPGGQVQSVSIIKSSGYPRLDGAAVQAVRGMSYKPFAAAGEGPRSTEVSVAFKLGDQQPKASSYSKDI